MAATIGTSGFGTLLKRGDGGVGAGTQASKTVGTSNQTIVAKAQVAGTDGNSMSFGIVVSGTSTAFSYTISSTSLVITSATDGGGLATTTVNEAIYQIQDDVTYRDFWELTRGGGNGTGVLVASAASNLSGGTNGTEVFATIAEVVNITLNGPNLELIDATHMESPNAYREFIPSLLDGGDVSFSLNFLPATASQTVLKTDMENRTRRNFQLTFTDTGTTTYAFAGYVTSLSASAVIDDKLSSECTIKITGPITVS